MTSDDAEIIGIHSGDTRCGYVYVCVYLYVRIICNIAADIKNCTSLIMNEGRSQNWKRIVGDDRVS